MGYLRLYFLADGTTFHTLAAVPCDKSGCHRLNLCLNLCSLGALGHFEVKHLLQIEPRLRIPFLIIMLPHQITN